jgi:hypothetical protein
VNDSISMLVKSCLGQGVRSLELLVLGEGRFLPPKLPLLLQHTASPSLKHDACLGTSYGIFSYIVYMVIHLYPSRQIPDNLDNLVIDLLSTN